MKLINRKKLMLASILLFLSIDFSGAAIANNTVHSVDIVEGTLKGLPHCLHYQVVGVCFWLRCSATGCDVETTPKINQYLPDAVVSVYTQHNNNPWWFAKHLEDPAFYRAGQIEMRHLIGFNLGAGGDEPDQTRRDINNKFHEVDIIGNPALAVIDHEPGMLPSTAIPFMPYYSSLLDAYAWRFPGLERFYPGSLIPGLDDVGVMVLHDWAQLYPRNGYVNQPDDAKAGAVDAIRAATIITALGQPHLYAPLSNHCGSHCKAYPAKANSKNTEFQMIYPDIQTQCMVFGGSDFTNPRSWETKASIKGHDRYIWVLWRRYHGCLPDPGAKYLSSVNF